MMDKRALFFGIIILIISCKEPAVKKPDILIEKNVMVDIMYDLSLLEAMKAQSVRPLENYNLNPSSYIYKKYKIDSLQFVQNNMYYASDYKAYKKMNEEINERLDKNKMELEALIKKQKKAIAKKLDSSQKKNLLQSKK